MQSDSLTMLKDLEINFNSDGWGPVTGGRLPIFEGVPYAHFDKKDRQVRPADFVSTNAPVQQRFQRRYDTATDFAYRHDVAEDQTFQLVDTAKSASKFKSGTFSLNFLFVILLSTILLYRSSRSQTPGSEAPGQKWRTRCWTRWPYWPRWLQRPEFHSEC